MRNLRKILAFLMNVSIFWKSISRVSQAIKTRILHPFRGKSDKISFLNVLETRETFLKKCENLRQRRLIWCRFRIWGRIDRTLHILELPRLVKPQLFGYPSAFGGDLATKVDAKLFVGFAGKIKPKVKWIPLHQKKRRKYKRRCHMMHVVKKSM